MSTVRIWAVKSDREAKAVRSVANKLVTDWQLSNLSIQSAGRISSLVRKGISLSDALRKATQHYLKQDDYVIFVADSNSPPLTHQQPQESDSLIHHIDQVVQDNIFDGKVFLARSVQELTAWLPIVHKSLAGRSTKWQEEWNSVITSFHDAFANTPQDEVARDLDETLAEVRSERT